MSLVWSDETKQRELSQRQPMTRARLNWWMVAAGIVTVGLWLMLVSAGRLLWWCYGQGAGEWILVVGFAAPWAIAAAVWIVSAWRGESGGV